MAVVPHLIQRFISSSGQTVVEYYEYDSGLSSAGIFSGFRGVINVPSGFDQAEVFLSGFQLQMGASEDTVEMISVAVQKHFYTNTTGELEMSVNAHLRTGNRQKYSYRITFVLILTGANLAKFTPISTGCGGIGRCNITRSLPTAIPAGMNYIGLATQIWHIGSNSGPLRLNTLSGHVNNIVVNTSMVNIDYMFVMEDASAQNKMFAEWGAKVIAFDPTEMVQHGGRLFPQYTFCAVNTPNRAFWMEHSSNPSISSITGFLNAFEGLSLFDSSAIGPSPSPYPFQRMDKPIWLIESSAEGFAKHPFSSNMALTTYGIFLGTQFGNTSTAEPFGYQESRAFGFLR